MAASRVKRVGWNPNSNCRCAAPVKHHSQLSAQLAAAYNETSYERALELFKTTAVWLERLCPAAAASLHEGMDETLTVVRLGVPKLLGLTLTTTNPVESALSVDLKVTGRVKRWRRGNMCLCWCTAGLLRAVERFAALKATCRCTFSSPHSNNSLTPTA